MCPVDRVGVVGIDWPQGMGAIGLLVVGSDMILWLVVSSICWLVVSRICNWLVVTVAGFWSLVVMVIGSQGSGTSCETPNTWGKFCY